MGEGVVAAHRAFVRVPFRFACDERTASQINPSRRNDAPPIEWFEAGPHRKPHREPRRERTPEDRQVQPTCRKRRNGPGRPCLDRSPSRWPEEPNSGDRTIAARPTDNIAGAVSRGTPPVPCADVAESVDVRHDGRRLPNPLPAGRVSASLPTSVTLQTGAQRDAAIDEVAVNREQQSDNRPRSRRTGAGFGIRDVQRAPRAQ